LIAPEVAVQLLPYLGVAALLLVAVAFRGKAKAPKVLRVVWVIVLLLALIALAVSLQAGRVIGPAILLGISVIGIVCTSWVLADKTISIGGKKSKKRGRKRGRKKLLASKDPRVFRLARLAPVAIVLAVGALLLPLLVPSILPPLSVLVVGSPDIPSTSLATGEVDSESLNSALGAADLAIASGVHDETIAVLDGEIDSRIDHLTDLELGVARLMEEERQVKASLLESRKQLEQLRGQIDIANVALAKTNTPASPPLSSPLAIADTNSDAGPGMFGESGGVPAVAAVTPLAMPQPFEPPAPVAFKGKRTVSFRSHVVPLLKAHCLDCHNEEKQKGDLRLDSTDAIRKGGKNGWVVVAGQPDRSPLYTMTALDADDPDVMPSKGELLSEAQQEILKVWIEEGADLEDGRPFSGTAIAAGSQLPTSEGPVAEANTTALDPKALADMQRRYTVFRPINADHSLVEVVVRQAHPEDLRRDLERLVTIAPNIHSLDLARTDITDADLQMLGDCRNLKTLRLANTAISDAGLKHLSQLPRLESLNLTGTKITGAAVAQFQAFPALKEVFAMASGISAADASGGTGELIIRVGF